MNSDSNSNFKISPNWLSVILKWLILLVLIYILVLLIQYDRKPHPTELDIETKKQLREIHSFMSDLKENGIDVYQAN